MALETGPRVEVQLKAMRICDLSGNPRFDFVLLLTVRNAKGTIFFLKDGLQENKSNVSRSTRTRSCNASITTPVSSCKSCVRARRLQFYDLSPTEVDT